MHLFEQLLFLLVTFLCFNTVATNGCHNTKPTPGAPPCPAKCECCFYPRPRTSEIFSSVTCEGLDEVPLDLPPLTLYLWMKNGQITHVPEKFFTRFAHLKTLDISSQQISNTFLFPPTLWLLDLSKNQLNAAALHGMFTNLSGLRTLNLADNPINGHILNGTFANLKNLRNLNLAKSGITGIETGAFTGLDNISDLDLKSNNLTHLTKGMLKGIQGDKFKQLKLSLKNNHIAKVDEGLFAEVAHIGSIDLSRNKLSEIPDFSGISGSFQNLRLNDNNISDISALKKLEISTVTELSLSNNNITKIEHDTFSNTSVIVLLDLSYNNISYLPDNFLTNSPKLSELMLHTNVIDRITLKTFEGLNGLRGLYISNNRLKFLPDGAFSRMALRNLFMYDNKFKKLSGRPFQGMQSPGTRIYLFSNNISKIEGNVMYDLNSKSQVVVDCQNLRELPYTKEYPASPKIVCAPANLDVIRDQRHEVAHALRRSGFQCDRKAADDYDCKLCVVGTHGKNVEDPDASTECVNCPAGGFYQDEMGKVNCKNCLVGTFVHPDHAPATTPTRCLACPQGTQSNKLAGYRACPCLTNFSRTDRFGPCTQCSTKGLVCQKDYSILSPGYFWDWNWGSNGTLNREEYKEFIENLEKEDEEAIANYGNKHKFGRHGKFAGSLPRAHKCPRESCRGGLDSNCSEGYTGPLCAICHPYYYQRFNKCLRCPSRLKASLQIAGVVVLFALVVAAVLWGDRKRAENGRTIADVIISCFKIVVGFYQVMVGVFSSFSNVEWPTAVVWIGKYLRYIELNVVEVAPLGCLYDKFTMNAMHEFVIAVSVNIFVILIILTYLLIRVSCIRCSKALSYREIADGVRNVKKSCYRNICLFLFATYPMTSAKIIQILPANCQKLCFDTDKKHCTLFLRTDYSVKCYTDTHYWYWHVAAGFLVYPIGFPLIILLLVWVYVYLPSRKASTNTSTTAMTNANSFSFVFSRNKRGQPGDEPAVKFGLSLFYENYRPHCWYWEVVEMARKVLLTSVLILIGPHSRTQIGIGAIISALFAILYVYLRPIANKFENLLQTIALMAIFLNLSVGVMLKISDEDINPDVNLKADATGVSVLLIFINSMIILIVSVCCIRVIAMRLAKWRKSPRPVKCGPVNCLRCWLGCCLSLLVPCSFTESNGRLRFTSEEHEILMEAEEYMKQEH